MSPPTLQAGQHLLVNSHDLEATECLPEKTNQMGGACPTLACSHLASLLQMVPLKPSLPTSSARWLASLYVEQLSAWAAVGSARQDCKVV